MRKKVSVETLRREKGDTKENQELPQTTLDNKKANPDISDLPLNGNHKDEDGGDHEDETFDDDDKDSSLDQDDPPQQQLP